MVYHERALHNHYYFYRAIENREGTECNQCETELSCEQRTMGRLEVIPLNIQWLSCILIGCIVYGML